jgi:glucan phosphoethanolaminetransferase (alkaline phosphatase superfamily)
MPHADFVVALLVATLMALIEPMIRFDDYRSLLELLPQLGYVKFCGALVLVFAQSAAIFYVVAQFPQAVRLPAIFIFFLIACVQISYFFALDRYMSSTDLFMALTVGKELVQGAMASFFNPLAVLWAVPYLIFSVILLAVAYKSHLWKKLGVTLSVAIFLVVSNYAFFVKVNERYFHLNPLTSLIRSVLYYQFQNILEYHGPRDELPEVQVTEKLTDSIIYIIDESIRGSQLSLNGYPRPTTPFLQSLEKAGRLRNLGICVAASSYSYITNAYLLSGHKKFPDKDLRTAKNPLLFDYAKKMGYKTIFIDVNGSYLTNRAQRARQKSIRSVDLWMTVADFKRRNFDAEKDLAVARFVRDLLKDAGGYFIVVNKKGLHFPYRARYPNDPVHQIWQPTMEAH